MSQSAPTLFEYRPIDDLMVGDLVRYGSNNVLIRDFIVRPDGARSGAVVSWRSAKSGRLLTGRIYTGWRLKGLVRRGVPLDETAEEGRFQRAIEEGRIKSNGHWSHVYFLAYFPANLVKIGLARKSVRTRVKGIASLSPVGPLTLLGTVEGNRKTEQALHARFAHLRHHGEWFTLNSEIRDYIAEHCQPEEPAL